MTAMSAASPISLGSAYARGSALLRRNWGWFVFRGALALLLGVVTVLFPLNALFAFTLVFAAYAGADGILSLIAGVRGATKKEDRWWALVLRGAIGVAAAVLVALMPGVATVSYALVTLGVLIGWALLTGMLEIAAAVRLRKEIKGEWLLAISGVLSVLLGLWIWAMLWIYPVASILSVAWVIAAWAFFAGFTLIGLGMRLRRLQKAENGLESRSDETK
jgi:uncharacterized membrane protein HdeD (DUF308 family)